MDLVRLKEYYSRLFHASDAAWRFCKTIREFILGKEQERVFASPSFLNRVINSFDEKDSDNFDEIAKVFASELGINNSVRIAASKGTWHGEDALYVAWEIGVGNFLIIMKTCQHLSTLTLFKGDLKDYFDPKKLSPPDEDDNRKALIELNYYKPINFLDFRKIFTRALEDGIIGSGSIWD